MSIRLAGRTRKRRGGYLLRDDFNDALAAGALNGTPAAPKGGLRSVSDSNLRLSSGGGSLIFASGGAGYGNPGLWYAQSVARAPGRCLVTRFNYGSGSEFMFGLDGAERSGMLDQAAWYLAPGGTFNVYESGQSLAALFSPTPGLTYSLALVLRASGAFYLAKGGIFGSWCLLYPSRTNSGGAAAALIGRTASAGSFDFVRIPSAAVQICPLAADSFTRANGALGSTDGAAAGEAGGAGLVWNGASWGITGNAAAGAPAPGSELALNGSFALDASWNKDANWTIGAGTANHAAGAGNYLYQALGAANTWYQVTYSLAAASGGGTTNLSFGSGGPMTVYRGSPAVYTQAGRMTGTPGVYFYGSAAGTVSIDNVSVKPLNLASLVCSLQSGRADVLLECAPVISAGTQTGLVMCLDSAASPANFLLAYHDGSSVVLEKCLGGVYTTLINSAATYASGARLVLVKDGSALRLYYNEQLAGAQQSVGDGAIINNTLHGLFSTYAGNSLGGFAAWARGAGGEYGVLDRFSG